MDALKRLIYDSVPAWSSGVNFLAGGQLPLVFNQPCGQSACSLPLFSVIINGVYGFIFFFNVGLVSAVACEYWHSNPYLVTSSNLLVGTSFIELVSCLYTYVPTV
ncbi:expressed protein [Echinococcus multilocularis]|uniref:Expressed protein n=1 Tax=Echinococcus multilocularis TaxID=6211 RepID=A0A068YDJ7_ECHMU|nr:expressed protein [Echinococcus multilocularis]